MGIVLLLFGLGVLCTLLWTCAVYALPLWAGFATGFWALAHGAGIGAVAIGLIAGIAVFVLGRTASLSSNPLVRWTALIAVVSPAIYAGFNMVWELSAYAVPSPTWRAILSLGMAAIVGATTVAKLIDPPDTMRR